MHWLQAAMVSKESALDLRGLRPRSSRQGAWSREWERLQRESQAGSEEAGPLPWWKSAFRPVLRSRLS